MISTSATTIFGATAVSVLLQPSHVIDATEEQVDELIAKFAPQTGKSVEELKATFSEGDFEYFKADAIRDNAVKFLVDNAQAE